MAVDNIRRITSPEYRRHLLTFVAPFEDQLTRWPAPEEIRAVLSVVVDADDAPIFAAAVVAKPDIVLSNDFQTFHSAQAKAFWTLHEIEVKSLYGLLCVFGLRERKKEEQDEGVTNANS